jgi:hypothetical protein
MPAGNSHDLWVHLSTGIRTEPKFLRNLLSIMAMRLIASLVRKEVIFYVKVQGNPAASINHRALWQTDRQPASCWTRFCSFCQESGVFAEIAMGRG